MTGRSVVLFTSLNGFYNFYASHIEGYDYAGYGLLPCYTDIPLIAWFYEPGFSPKALRGIAKTNCTDEQMISVNNVDDAIDWLKGRYERVIVQPF